MENNIEKFQTAHFGFETGEHQNKSVIWISFPCRQELINHLKSYTKAKWSATNKKWYVPDVAFYRNLFGIELKYYGKSALTAIHPVNQNALSSNYNSKDIAQTQSELMLPNLLNCLKP